ncbi:hypothetical protein B0H14DRAFT_2591619 [Mycena olivaceomarginata]|nr:hypothetical protein B0H14DRAFT_2591619 [Mycena olivaceomarginata]
MDSGGSELAVTLLDEAIDPEYPIFEMISDDFHAGRLSPEFTHYFFNSTRALISYLPAEVRKPEWSRHILPEDSQYPYPIMDMATPEPIWKWWQQLQQEPMTPPSASPAPDPVTPIAQNGPSAVGSASFDIRSLRSSTRKDPPAPRNASAIAVSPSPSSEMQVDLPEMSSADALAIAEALDDPSPRRGPPRTATRGNRAPRWGAPPVCSVPAVKLDKQVRPMIIAHSSRKSVTLSAEEAYHEEGKEAGEEEEEAEEPARPTKRQRTSSRTATGQAPGQGQGQGSPRCGVACQRATRSHRGCSNCIFCNRDCEHGKPGVLCDHCNKGRLSHCSHTFTVPEHIRAANYMSRGNELLLDLSAARIDYELARESLFRASSRLAVTSNRIGAWIRKVTASLGADGLPGMDEIPEELQPLWGQLLLYSQAQLTARLSCSHHAVPVFER